MQFAQGESLPASLLSLRRVGEGSRRAPVVSLRVVALDFAGSGVLARARPAEKYAGRHRGVAALGRRHGGRARVYDEFPGHQGVFTKFRLRRPKQERAPLGTTGPHAAPDDAGRSGRPQGRVRPPGPRRPGGIDGRAQRDGRGRWVGDPGLLRAGLVAERAGVSVARTRGRASSPGSRCWRGSTSRRGRR